jgi:hypothetical protein
MAVEAWLLRAAETMWARTGGPPPFPRDVNRLARYGLHVRPVPMPRLSVSLVGEWLRRAGLPIALQGSDRALRGCLVACFQRPHVFLDADDPPDEQRYTMAHELAHLWLEVLLPRERVRGQLGEKGLQVLDGQRPPTAAERCQALLHRVSLTPAYDLMERDGELGLVHGGVLLAEEKADRLALELLAPEDAALRGLPEARPWSEWLPLAGERLAEEFALPAPMAAAYARRLAPSAGVAPSFWERLSGSHLTRER